VGKKKKEKVGCVFVLTHAGRVHLLLVRWKTMDRMAQWECQQVLTMHRVVPIEMLENPFSQELNA
jgi:hypothetical protein